jgi:hypothetical protein
MRFSVVGEPRYRMLSETRIVDQLLLQGWIHAWRSGDRAAAVSEVKATLERLVALGLPYARAPDGARLFDPFETMNFVRWAGQCLGEPTTREHCAPTARRLVLEAHGAAGQSGEPLGPERLGAQPYAVTIRRTFNLKGWRPGERVRLRLPAPIADTHLTDLAVDFLPSAGFAGETSLAPARLDVMTKVPESGQLTLGMRARFCSRPVVPTGGAALLDPAAAELYTRPSEGLIKVTPRIAELARVLAGGETDPMRLARRFWDFIMDELALGGIHYDALDRTRCPELALDQGWYDCNLGSALLVSLCRARGTPARLVTGYMLYEAAPGLHSWAEIWAEGAGWTPFDLFSEEMAWDSGDEPWRNYFFGRMEHRMVVERPPHLFNGAGAVRLPPVWVLVGALEERGVRIEYLDVETGALVYRDRLEVERLGPPMDAP